MQPVQQTLCNSPHTWGKATRIHNSNLQAFREQSLDHLATPENAAKVVYTAFSGTEGSQAGTPGRRLEIMED